MLLELAERFQDAAVARLLVGELSRMRAARSVVLGARHRCGSSATRTDSSGRALVLAGRLEDAVTAYRTAMDCDERIGARPDVALGRLDIARTSRVPDWPSREDRPATLRPRSPAPRWRRRSAGG